MSQCIQLPENVSQHQPLPHLPSTSSRPLPTIPSSEPQQHSPLTNNAHHRFSSNNIENRPLYDTHRLPFRNDQYSPLYDTQIPFTSTYSNLPTGPPVYHTNGNNFDPNIQNFSTQRYPSSPYLPTIKEPTTPSTPMYIPILTGRSDWCPWSEALMMAVMTMNLFSHIMEYYDPQWGFDPGLMPTYPPTINQDSLPDELHMWNLWWARDGQVLHLLISRLSPSVHVQLPGAGSSQPR